MNISALKFTIERIDGLFFLDKVQIKSEFSEYDINFDEFLGFAGKYIVDDLNYWFMFVYYELIRRDFSQIIEDKVRLVNNSFTYLINDQNDVYQILIKTRNGRIELQSFDKKFGSSLNTYKKQAKIENMQDLDAILHAVNVLERNDIDDCLTIGSSAVKYFKKQRYCHSAFSNISDKEDEFVRKSYFGGICQKFEDEYDGTVNVIDCNSLYPFVMAKYNFPNGSGIKFHGDDYEDFLYVQHIKCYVTLKKNAMPCLFEESVFQDSAEPIYFGEIDRVMTNVDIENMFKCYNVADLQRLEGYKYKYSNGMFNKYISTFYKLKKESKNKDMGTYYIAKMMLNNLGGKFAIKRTFTRTIYTINKNYDVESSKADIKSEGWYIPVAAFMTAYARKELIDMFNKIQSYKNEFCLLYCDTDCLHIKGEIPKEVIDLIDDFELGKWKHEGTFKAGKYLKQKVYALMKNGGECKFTVAGCSERAKSQLTWDSFKEGTIVYNIVNKRAVGGYEKYEVPFML